MEDLTQYSKPVRIDINKLGHLYYVKYREASEKVPGRTFEVVYDERFPVAHFNIKYAYVSRFLLRGATSGNHYHKEKEEVFTPLEGNFDVYLENINTKEKEKIQLDRLDGVNMFLHIPANIAHRVVCKEDKGLLLVLASVPSDYSDVIHYDVE